MNNSEIIIDLIKQDLLYNQYLAALKKLGIEIYGFDLDLVSVIAKILNKSDYSDAWIELYTAFISRCDQFEIVPQGRNLYPLAQECYTALKDFTH